jgi:hypothetical protein
VLPGIASESASQLCRLHLPLQLLDISSLPNGLTVHRVLEPFEHRFEVIDASLDHLETLRRLRVIPALAGSAPGSAQVLHALEHPS